MSDGCTSSSATLTVEAVCAELPVVDAGDSIEIIWATSGAVALDGLNGTAGTAISNGSIAADGSLPAVGTTTGPGIMVHLAGSLSAGVIGAQNSTGVFTNSSFVAVRWEFISVPYAEHEDGAMPRGRSGPNNATAGTFMTSVGSAGVPSIFNATTLRPSFLASTTGTYSLALIATDGCASVSDVIHVHVLCAAPSTNPISATGGLRSRISAATARTAGAASPAPSPPIQLQSATVPVGAWVDLAGAFDYSAYLGSQRSHMSGLLGPYSSGPSTTGATGLDPAPALPQMVFEWSISEEAPTLDTGGSYLVPIAQQYVLSRVGLVSSTGIGLDRAEEEAAGVTGLHWRVLSAPIGATATIEDPSVLRPTVLASLAGEYELRVEAFVGCAFRSGTARLLVECSSRPRADAGDDMSVVLGTPAVIDGTASTDAESPDGLVYTWTLLSAPLVQRPGGGASSPTMVTRVGNAASLQALGSTSIRTASIASRTTDMPSLTPDGLGTYELQISVNDGCSVDTDTVRITAVCVDPPLLDAGAVRGVLTGVADESFAELESGSGDQVHVRVPTGPLLIAAGARTG